MVAITLLFIIILLNTLVSSRGVHQTLECSLGDLLDSATARFGFRRTFRHTVGQATTKWFMIKTDHRFQFDTVIEHSLLVDGIDEQLLVATTRGPSLHAFLLTTETLTAHAHYSTDLNLTARGVRAFWDTLTGKAYVLVLSRDNLVTWYSVHDKLTPCGSMGVPPEATSMSLFSNHSLHVLLVWAEGSTNGLINIYATTDGKQVDFRDCGTVLHLPDPLRDVSAFWVDGVHLYIIFCSSNHTLVYRYFQATRQVAPHQKLPISGMKAGQIGHFLVIHGSDNGVATYELSGTLFRLRGETSGATAAIFGTKTLNTALVTSQTGTFQILAWDPVLGTFAARDMNGCYEWMSRGTGTGPRFEILQECVHQPGGPCNFIVKLNDSSYQFHQKESWKSSQQIWARTSIPCVTDKGSHATGKSSLASSSLEDEILVAVTSGGTVQIWVLTPWDNQDGHIPDILLDELQERTRRLHQLLDQAGKLGLPESLQLEDLSKRFRNIRHTPTPSFKRISARRVTVKDLHVTTLNGLDVDSVLQDVVTKGYGSIVNGVKTFATGSRFNRVQVTKTVNSVPREDLLDRSTEQTIPGDLVFQDHVQVKGDVTVSGNVNGIKLSRDAVTLSGPKQTIKGFKSFKGQLDISTDTSVYGRCNGVNLTALAGKVLRSSVPQIVLGQKTFTSVAAEGDVNARKLCGWYTRRLFAMAVTLDSYRLIQAPKTFLKNVKFTGGNVHVGTINKLRVPYTGNRAPRQVSANKVIIHGDLFVKRALNGEDVDHLLDDVILQGEDAVTVSGIKTFEKPQDLLGKVSIQGPLNGFKLQSDFVHPGQPATLSGVKTFSGPVVFRNRIRVAHTVDGVDIDQLAKEVMTLDGGIKVLGRKTFRGGITITGKMYRKGVDALAQEVLRQVDRVVVQGTTDTHALNGKPLDQWASTRITLNTDQRLNCDCVVYAKVRASGAIVKGPFNRIDMRLLHEDSLRISSMDQVISGRKTFSGTVNLPAVRTEATINALDPNRIHAKSIKLNQDLVTSALISEAVTVDGPLGITGTFNGLDFAAFSRDSLSQTKTEQMVHGVTTFEHLQVRGDLEVAHGVPFLTVTTDQTVTGSYRFCNDLRVSNANCPNVLNAKPENVVFKKTVTTEKLTVTQDGCHQWRNLSSDAVTDHTNYITPITGQKTILGNLKIEGNVKSYLINAMNFTSELRNSFENGGTHGAKAFDSRQRQTFERDVTIEGHAHVERGAFLERRATNRRLERVHGRLALSTPLVLTGQVASRSLAAHEIKVKGDLTAKTFNNENICGSKGCQDGFAERKNLRIIDELSLDEGLTEVHVSILRNAVMVTVSCGNVCALPSQVEVYRWNPNRNSLVYSGTVAATSVVKSQTVAKKPFLVTGNPDTALWVLDNANWTFERLITVPGNSYVDTADFYTVKDLVYLLVTSAETIPTVFQLGPTTLLPVLSVEDLPLGVSVGKVLTVDGRVYFLLGNPGTGQCYLVEPRPMMRIIQTIACPRVTDIAFCPLPSSKPKGIVAIAQLDSTAIYSFVLEDHEPLKLERSFKSRGASRSLDYNCESQRLLEVTPRSSIKLYERKGESGFSLRTHRSGAKVTSAKSFTSGSRFHVVATDGQTLTVYGF